MTPEAQELLRLMLQALEALADADPSRAKAIVADAAAKLEAYKDAISPIDPPVTREGGRRG